MKAAKQASGRTGPILVVAVVTAVIDIIVVIVSPDFSAREHIALALLPWLHCRKPIVHTIGLRPGRKLLQ